MSKEEIYKHDFYNFLYFVEAKLKDMSLTLHKGLDEEFFIKFFKEYGKIDNKKYSLINKTQRGKGWTTFLCLYSFFAAKIKKEDVLIIVEAKMTDYIITMIKAFDHLFEPIISRYSSKQGFSYMPGSIKIKKNTTYDFSLSKDKSTTTIIYDEVKVQNTGKFNEDVLQMVKLPELKKIIFNLNQDYKDTQKAEKFLKDYLKLD